jgi:hypothetical protein
MHWKERGSSSRSSFCGLGRFSSKAVVTTQVTCAVYLRWPFRRATRRTGERKTGLYVVPVSGSPCLAVADFSLGRESERKAVTTDLKARSTPTRDEHHKRWWETLGISGRCDLCIEDPR